jgi:hypothetical protein
MTVPKKPVEMTTGEILERLRELLAQLAAKS